MFPVYPEAICGIARKHGINIHTYADEIQSYMCHLMHFVACLSAPPPPINEKTVLFISPLYFTDASVRASGSARNFGVLFDDSVHMSNHRTVFSRLIL